LKATKHNTETRAENSVFDYDVTCRSYKVEELNTVDILVGRPYRNIRIYS